MRLNEQAIQIVEIVRPHLEQIACFAVSTVPGCRISRVISAFDGELARLLVKKTADDGFLVEVGKQFELPPGISAEQMNKCLNSRKIMARTGSITEDANLSRPHDVDYEVANICVGAAFEIAADIASYCRDTASDILQSHSLGFDGRFVLVISNPLEVQQVKNLGSRRTAGEWEWYVNTVVSLVPEWNRERKAA